MTDIDDLVKQISTKKYLDGAALDNVRHCASAMTMKVTYLEGVNASGSKSDAELFHGVFRKDKVRTGPEVDDLDPMEGLGFLAREDTFKRVYRNEFKMDAVTFEATYKNWIAYYEAHAAKRTPSNDERLAARAFLESPLPTRMDGEAWLFRNPTGDWDAFNGITDSNLPRRLGLILVPGERRLTMGFHAKHVVHIRRPQFVDATWDYLSFWDWRGKTRPLPGTPPAVNGLREVVAKPPILRDLSRPIEAIMV